MLGQKIYTFFLGVLSLFLCTAPLYATDTKKDTEAVLNPKPCLDIKDLVPELNNLLEKSAAKCDKALVDLYLNNEELARSFLNSSIESQKRLYMNYVTQCFPHYIDKDGLDELKGKFLEFVPNTIGMTRSSVLDGFIRQVAEVDFVHDMKKPLRVSWITLMLRQNCLNNFAGSYIIVPKNVDTSTLADSSFIKKDMMGGVLVGGGFICLVIFWIWNYLQEQLYDAYRNILFSEEVA